MYCRSVILFFVDGRGLPRYGTGSALFTLYSLLFALCSVFGTYCTHLPAAVSNPTTAVCFGPGAGNTYLCCSSSRSGRLLTSPLPCAHTSPIPPTPSHNSKLECHPPITPSPRQSSQYLSMNMSMRIQKLTCPRPSLLSALFIQSSSYHYYQQTPLVTCIPLFHKAHVVDSRGYLFRQSYLLLDLRSTPYLFLPGSPVALLIHYPEAEDLLLVDKGTSPPPPGHRPTTTTKLPEVIARSFLPTYIPDLYLHNT